jgi:hypothetical protein
MSAQQAPKVKIDREKLKAAIRTLGAADDEVEGLAEHLLFAAGMALVAKLPRMQATRSARQAKAELAALARTAGQLVRHLESMHGDTLAMVSANGKQSPFRVAQYAGELADRATAAMLEVPERKVNTSPEKLETIRLARVCASFYTDMTGKMPASGYDPINEKADGPFVRFLSDVFAALGVKGTAGHYAKAAVSGDLNDIRGGYAPRIRRVGKPPV